MIEELELAIMVNAVVLAFVFFKIYQHVLKQQHEQDEKEQQQKLTQQEQAHYAIEHLRQQRAQAKAQHRSPKTVSQVHQSLLSFQVLHKNLPEDSALRRHYLTHLKATLETTLSPRPTDFNLRRHYDNMVEAKIEDCLNDKQKMGRLITDYAALNSQISFTPVVKTQAQQTTVHEHSNLPQDSVLKRHYLTHLKAMLETTLFPRPTDFNLGRHYDNMIEAKITDCLDDKQKMAQLVADYEATQKSKPVSAKQVQKVQQVIPNCHLPEDATLRRHYLTQLKAMVETTLFPRPTEFNLRRHYDNLITAKIADCLNNENRLNQLTSEYEVAKKKLCLS